MYQLRLIYFKSYKPCLWTEISDSVFFIQTKSHDVTIRFNLFSDLVYENKFESQLCMIYDSNKRLCGTSNAFPFRYGYKLKLDKGDFTAKIQVFLYVCRLNRVVLCNYIKKGCGISKSKKYLRLSPYSISVRYIEMKRHLDV